MSAALVVDTWWLLVRGARGAEIATVLALLVGGGGARGSLTQIEPYYRGLGRGRLVVLGEAGAGKTVLAISLDP